MKINLTSLISLFVIGVFCIQCSSKDENGSQDAVTQKDTVSSDVSQGKDTSTQQDIPTGELTCDKACQYINSLCKFDDWDQDLCKENCELRPDKENYIKCIMSKKDCLATSACEGEIPEEDANTTDKDATSDGELTCDNVCNHIEELCVTEGSMPPGFKQSCLDSCNTYMVKEQMECIMDSDTCEDAQQGCD